MCSLYVGDGIIYFGDTFLDFSNNDVSGIYFCVVKSENSTHSKKIVMAK